MTEIRWTVPKSFTRCTRCGAKTTIKVEGNAASVACTDPECGHSSSYTLRERREIKACEQCGVFRRVTVTISLFDGKPHWRLTCTACDYDNSAAIHEYYARKLRAKAAEVRAKRVRKKAETKP